MIRVLVMIMAMLGAPSFAVEPSEMLADPAMEARAQAIGKEVRCLVCRNESIEDSHADLARDLRLVVRERVLAGDTDDEVMTFLSDRFGDFVRLRPRFGGATLWLWLAGPILILLGAAIAISFVLRGRNAADMALSDGEEDALQQLLDHDRSN